MAGEPMVHDPRDNGGRPVIVVPGSNWLEFTLTEYGSFLLEKNSKTKNYLLGKPSKNAIGRCLLP